MPPSITNEQRRALEQSQGSVEVVDDHSQRRYILTDSERYPRAMKALEREGEQAANDAGSSAASGHSQPDFTFGLSLERALAAERDLDAGQSSVSLDDLKRRGGR